MTPSLDHAAAERTRRILRRLLGEQPEGLTIRLWDGSVWPAASGGAQATLILTHPGALRRMLAHPLDVAIGESYLRGDFEIEGDLETAIRMVDQILQGVRSPRDAAAVFRLTLGLPQGTGPAEDVDRRAARLHGEKHTPRRDRQAVAHHYDVGNDFFRLWLDRRLVYSCAYFLWGDEDLDVAQEAKLELICRKLRLRPGERLLDIGCGWAGLVMYAAERYGVSAVGITLSRAQVELAGALIAEAGLQEQCRVELRDYREIPAGAFDKIASVGMFEHVGRARLREYFTAAWSALRPGGLFLNHGIATASGAPRSRSSRPAASFIDRYVFPDGELVTLSEALGAAEQAAFEVRDVESLREHYALTLRQWGQRLEARRAEAVAAAGESIYRTWRLFMAASAYGFTTGRINVYQAVLSKPDAQGRSGLPLSRADIYGGAPDARPSAFLSVEETARGRRVA